MIFTLQEMVQQVHGEVDRRVKIAQAGSSESEADTSKKNSKTPASNPATMPERNEESITEKTSAAFVEKLASAVEHCNAHFLKQANEGAGTGHGATETNLNAAKGGEQSEETGQATSKNIVPMSSGSDSKSPGQINPGTAMSTDMNDRPGGSESWENKDVMKQASAIKVASLRAALAKATAAPTNISKVARVLGLSKEAEDAINPAKISAGSAVPPDSSVAEEGVPSQPSEVTTQKRHIQSSEAAINLTKRDAKAVPKERMGEVLSEPAQKKSTDPVLHNNLDATSSAGVKISSVKVAAARAFLRKVAEEGAGDSASSDQKERAAKLQAALEAKKSDNKEKGSMGGADAGGGGGGAGAAGMGGGASMPVGGGY